MSNTRLVALASADVVIPVLSEPQETRIASDVAPLAKRHTLVPVAVEGLEEALRAAPVPLSTMGRSLDEDREYFGDRPPARTTLVGCLGGALKFEIDAVAVESG